MAELPEDIELALTRALMNDVQAFVTLDNGEKVPCVCHSTRECFAACVACNFFEHCLKAITPDELSSGDFQRWDIYGSTGR